MKKPHYYILPNGTKVSNMKEGHTKLGIGSSAFRNLVRKGIVNKIEVKQSNAYSYDNEEKTI